MNSKCYVCYIYKKEIKCHLDLSRIPAKMAEPKSNVRKHKQLQYLRNQTNHNLQR